MKRMMTACGLVIVTVATALALGSPLPNYAGTWVLNKDKSKDLPPMMASMDNIEMVVTQNDKQITVKSSAGGGQEVAYNLDGSKGKAQMGGACRERQPFFSRRKTTARLC